ncbi:MAG: sigma-E processing peptidase SpoIIGA [Blautia sp.]|nr:sigma-E processing peptidase SpoIIGA [Lachnoclostridium sp.]MCM1210501.1 sigma-E processing peptidase SpoIIGA [Blautia sp.]
MYYKVYIDRVFFIQFVMNLYLLSITGKILKCTATHGRIVSGAALGAGMSCLIMLLPFGNMRIRLFFGVIPVSMFMIRVVFAVKKPEFLLKCSIVMGLCGFFFGSVMQWLVGFFLKEGRYGLWIYAFLGLCGYGFLWFLIGKLQKREEETLKEIRIPIEGQNIRMKALLDTGNHLYEPVSGAPVCIISESAAKEMQAYLIPERYHAIPYQSVGKERGILDAYELPELVIEESYREISCKRVVIAICNTGISKDGVYQMILHPALIEN